MLYHASAASLVAFLSSANPAAAQTNPFWTGYNGQVNPWQWGGPNQSESYYLNQTQEALSNMQATFWNGTYWVCKVVRI